MFCIALITSSETWHCFVQSLMFKSFCCLHSVMNVVRSRSFSGSGNESQSRYFGWIIEFSCGSCKAYIQILLLWLCCGNSVLSHNTVSLHDFGLLKRLSGGTNHLLIPLEVSFLLQPFAFPPRLGASLPLSCATSLPPRVSCVQAPQGSSSLPRVSL